jgi:hypothetical protein
LPASSTPSPKCTIRKGVHSRVDKAVRDGGQLRRSRVLRHVPSDSGAARDNVRSSETPRWASISSNAWCIPGCAPPPSSRREPLDAAICPSQTLTGSARHVRPHTAGGRNRQLLHIHVNRDDLTAKVAGNQSAHGARRYPHPQSCLAPATDRARAATAPTGASPREFLIASRDRGEQMLAFARSEPAV